MSVSDKHGSYSNLGLVAAAHASRIPVIITSAGGDGSSDHVDM